MTSSSLVRSVKVGKKGQLVVPKPMRDALGVKEGDDVIMALEGDRVILAHPQRYARNSRGALKGTWGRNAREVQRHLDAERRSWG